MMDASKTGALTLFPSHLEVFGPESVRARQESSIDEGGRGAVLSEFSGQAKACLSPAAAVLATVFPSGRTQKRAC